ncbi:Maf family protein [Bartonella ancashensis]|uniref:dTTP/UTP pyrophosphatase n=1 Tax=Bartonella ancashensis TaxID=1318743 RepID=A0A0M4M525_9HYPH|nr:Maf family nucleotide pyrophosphatase [Bartonella ancashensis]ALE03079.1 Septum formation protein Maf [Bartonella ancashensis]
MGIDLVLASASPRRLELLAQVGLKPDYVYPADINEAYDADEQPAHLAKRLAEEKALKAQDDFILSRQKNAELPFLKKYPLGKYLIVAADTVVAVGAFILPKPSGEEEAYKYLHCLSGKSHTVCTAVSILNEYGKKVTRLVKTSVRFKSLTPSNMRDYVASGEWKGKAGGYAIQGKAAAFIVEISGSYTNVVGLPLAETVALLSAYGYPVFSNWVQEGDVRSE